MYGHRMMYFEPNESLAFETIRSCPLCLADLRDAREIDTRTLYLHDLCEGISIVQCPQCGLVMQRTRLAASQWESFNNSYPSDGSRGWDSNEERFQGELELIRRHCPKGGSVLDIGCGYGELPKLLQERGFAAEGIDPRGDALIYGRRHYGLRLHEGFYDPAASKNLGTRFHAIVSIHAFEHFADPVSTLKLIGENLVAGGVAVLTVPDIAPLAEDPGIKPFDFYTPSHLFYFDASTLGAALGAAGFEVLRLERGFDPSSDKPVLTAAARKAGSQAVPTNPWKKSVTTESLDQFQRKFIEHREESVLRNIGALEPGSKTAIYGTWLYGLLSIHALEDAGHHVVKVVDSDRGKWEHLFAGQTIASPEELSAIGDIDAIVVTSINGFQSIQRTIREDLHMETVKVLSIAGGMIR
jgi:SAM-dependent methyltransferase